MKTEIDRAIELLRKETTEFEIKNIGNDKILQRENQKPVIK